MTARAAEGAIVVQRANDDEALAAEIVQLKATAAELRDKLTVARRRIRVLRGSDVLTHPSSRGVVSWLRAIVQDVEYGNTRATKCHLKALIETLEGADND